MLLSSSSCAAASTQKCSATHRKGPANARLHSCAASGLPNRSPSRASFEAERKPCEERREGRAINAYGGDIVVVAMRDPSHARRDLHPQFTGFHAGGQQWGCQRRLTPWHSRGAPAHPPVLGCAPSSFPDGQGVSPCLAWLRGVTVPADRRVNRPGRSMCATYSMERMCYDEGIFHGVISIDRILHRRQRPNVQGSSLRGQLVKLFGKSSRSLRGNAPIGAHTHSPVAPHFKDRGLINLPHRRLVEILRPRGLAQLAAADRDATPIELGQSEHELEAA